MVQNNKVRNFIFLAILEVFLVMIGILGAFQVDEWKDDRKKSELKKTYLKALLADFAQDTLDIQFNLRYQIEDTLRIAELQKEMTNANASLDDVLRIFVYEFDPRIGGLRSFNTNTIEAIVSTGNIDLLDPELSKSISKLRNTQEESKAFIEEFIAFYRNSNSTNSLGILSVINEGPVFEKIKNDIDKAALADEFNSKLTLKRQTYRISIRFLNSLLAQTRDLITTIKKEVN